MRIGPGCTLAAVLLSLAGSAFPQTALTGTISGQVIGTDARPLMAGIVANGVGGARASGRAQSDKTGSFTIRNLPAGTYMLCADVPGGGYLDPCAWESVLPTAQVNAGQTTAGYRLLLKQGGRLQVRVNDPAGLLVPAAAARPASNQVVPHILIGVMTARRLFQPLEVVSTDAAGRTQERTVPFNTPVVLHVRGNGVQVKDDKGADMALAGGVSTVSVAANAPATTITFTVSNAVKP